MAHARSFVFLAFVIAMGAATVNGIGDLIRNAEARPKQMAMIP